MGSVRLSQNKNEGLRDLRPAWPGQHCHRVPRVPCWTRSWTRTQHQPRPPRCCPRRSHCLPCSCCLPCPRPCCLPCPCPCGLPCSCPCLPCPCEIRQGDPGALLLHLWCL